MGVREGVGKGEAAPAAAAEPFRGTAGEAFTPPRRQSHSSLWPRVGARLLCTRWKQCLMSVRDLCTSGHFSPLLAGRLVFPAEGDLVQGDWCSGPRGGCRAQCSPPPDTRHHLPGPQFPQTEAATPQLPRLSASSSSSWESRAHAPVDRPTTQDSPLIHSGLPPNLPLPLPSSPRWPTLPPDLTAQTPGRAASSQHPRCGCFLSTFTEAPSKLIPPA